MTINAFDTPEQLTVAVVSAAKAAGRIAAGRYISGGGTWKHLTLEEIDVCKANGFGLWLIDEGAGDAGQFAGGKIAGSKAGAQAAKIARSLGVPDGTPIFVGIDFDADEDDVSDIASYMTGYKSSCGPYKAGMYADGLIASAVPSDCGDFVPGASGWPGTAEYIASGKVALIQHPPVKAFGIDTDPVEIIDPSVLWFPGGAVSQPSKQAIPSLRMPPLSQLQAILEVEPDGVWGPVTENAIATYYKAYRG